MIVSARKAGDPYSERVALTRNVRVNNAAVSGALAMKTTA